MTVQRRTRVEFRVRVLGLLPVLGLLLLLGLVLVPRGALLAAQPQAETGLQPRAYLPLVLSEAGSASPRTVQVTLDTGRRTVATVPLTGGEMSVSAADGTRFTLTLSDRTLLYTETITMTVVSGITGMPFGNPHAVHLEPEGLRLFEPAILTIEPAPPIAPEAQTFFAYDGMGAEFRLHPVLLDTTRMALPLFHFSGYGVAEGTDASRAAQLATPPTSPEAQFEQEVGEQVRHERVDPSDPDFLEQLEARARQHYAEVVLPKMQVARASGCQGDAGQSLVQQANDAAFAWERTLTLFGVGDEFMATERAGLYTFLGEMLQLCWEDATQPCMDWNNAAQVRRVLGLVRVAALLGYEEQYDLNDLEPCTCQWVTEIEEWTGSYSYSYDESGRGPIDGSGDNEVRVQRSANVTFRVNEAGDIGDRIYIWRGKVVAGGSGMVNDRHTIYTTHSPPHVFTKIGNTLLTTDPGNASLRVNIQTCQFEVDIGVFVDVVWSGAAGGPYSEVAYNQILVYEEPMPQGAPNQTLTFNASVPARYANTPYGVTHFNPYPGFTHLLERIRGEDNLGNANVTWSFTPVVPPPPP